MKKLQMIAIAIFIPVLTFAFQPTTAQAVDVPFGGVIIQFVPPIPYVCPVAHTLIFDLKTNALFGLVATGRVYEKYDLVTNGKFVLGQYSPVPYTCLLPWPIFPNVQVGTS